MSSRDLVLDSFESIGISISGESPIQYAPEDAVMLFLNDFRPERGLKKLSLIVLWLRHHRNLLRVERLKSLAKKLNDEQTIILKAIANKMINLGDQRWKSILALKSELVNYVISPSQFIDLKGYDEDFKQVGVSVIPFEERTTKKLRKSIYAIKNNTWIRNRMKYGSNLRADIITILELGLAKTAYEASKILGCSLNASYKNWNEIMFLKDHNIL